MLIVTLSIKRVIILELQIIIYIKLYNFKVWQKLKRCNITKLNFILKKIAGQALY